MPELPDVEGYRRTLGEHALGKRIRVLEARDPAVLRNADEIDAIRAFVGRAFLSEERRGKWLIARSAHDQLVFHFGMTGRLEWLEPKADLGRYVRLRIGYDDGSLVYRDPRRLRGVWLCANDQEVSDVTGPLGPDALGLSFKEFDNRLGTRRGAVKAALMDQRVIAGLGNMLSDEILWRAGVHPRSSYRDLSTARRKALHRALGTTLRQSVRAGSIPRRKRWLNSQRGAASPMCPKGHGQLRTSKVGGRTALWCEICQPEWTVR